MQTTNSFMNNRGQTDRYIQHNFQSNIQSQHPYKSKEYTIQNFSENCKDSVQCIKWANIQDNSSNKSEYFLTGSWDGWLRLYKLELQTRNDRTNDEGKLVLASELFFAMPVLCCEWGKTNEIIFVGLLDGTIKVLDPQAFDKYYEFFTIKNNVAPLEIFFVENNKSYLLIASSQSSIDLVNANQNEPDSFGKLVGHTEVPGYISAVDYQDSVVICGLSCHMKNTGDSVDGYWKNYVMAANLSQLFMNKDNSVYHEPFGMLSTIITVRYNKKFN